MAKKNKKLKRQLAKHEQHHAAIHRYIIRKQIEDGETDGTIRSYSHSIPESQEMMHTADVMCTCRPSRVSEDSQTGVVVWLHHGWIH